MKTIEEVRKIMDREPKRFYRNLFELYKGTFEYKLIRLTIIECLKTQSPHPEHDFFDLAIYLALDIDKDSNEKKYKDLLNIILPNNIVYKLRENLLLSGDRAYGKSFMELCDMLPFTNEQILNKKAEVEDILESDPTVQKLPGFITFGHLYLEYWLACVIDMIKPGHTLNDVSLAGYYNNDPDFQFTETIKLNTLKIYDLENKPVINEHVMNSVSYAEAVAHLLNDHHEISKEEGGNYLACILEFAAHGRISGVYLRDRLYANGWGDYQIRQFAYFHLVENCSQEYLVKALSSSWKDLGF